MIDRDPNAPAPILPDLLAFDVDTLKRLTSARAVRLGIDIFRSNRVTRIEEQPDALVAWIDGDGVEPGTRLAHVQVAGDGSLAVRADRAAAPDQAVDDPDDLWASGVAAIYAYQASFDVSDGAIRTAAARAVADRVVRGRQEVEVKATRSASPFGEWLASSVGVRRPGRDKYRVTVRSVRFRINGCSCPDFALSGLGTCKHTEAVHLRIAARRTSPHQASVFRLPYPDAVPVWAIQVPKSLVDGLARDGALPDTAEELEAGSIARFPEAVEDTAVRIFTLGLCSTSEVEAWVSRWVGDSRIHVGADVSAEIAREQRRVEQRARGARWRQSLEAWSGEIARFHAELFPYQREGVEFLVATGRALLADDMGLGKTMQAIAAASLMLEAGEVDRVLVVAPSSLAFQWKKEIERFSDAAVVVLEGSQSTRHRLMRAEAAFFVTTYDRLRLDFDVVSQTLRPDLLILDEAQRVKNWATRNAQHVSGLDTRFVFVLTGTPIENRLDELFSLLQIVDPEVLGPFWRFRRQFAVTDANGAPIGYRDLEALRRRLEPVLLRRDRKSVLLQLPSRTETTIYVELSPSQRSLHDSAIDVAKRYASIRRKRPLTPAEAQRLHGALQKARMACDSAHVADAGLLWESPKTDALRDLLQELAVDGGQKVVVFSEWIRMGELAGRLAAELGLGWVRLAGDLSSAQRMQLVEAFETDPEVRVFISSDAGATGLNLQSGTVLIHVDCPWNPAILEQRSARIHRQGQTQPVQIIRLIAQHAYESRVAQLVESKRALFDSVLGDGGSLPLESRQLDQLLAALDDAAMVAERPARSRGTDVDGGDGVEPDPLDEPAEDPSDDVSLGAHASSDHHGDDERIQGAPEAFGDAPEVHAEDPALESALAALQLGDSDRSLRVALLAAFLPVVPADAELVVVSGTLLVVVSTPDAMRSIDLADYAPLRIEVVTPAEHAAVLRVLKAPELRVPREAIPSTSAASPPQDAAARGDAPARAPRPDPRLTSARVLWEAAQPTLALQLLCSARLDDAAAKLGQRAPAAEDAWRWIYTVALPGGAIDTGLAGALALGLGLVQSESAEAAALESAWLGLGG